MGGAQTTETAEAAQEAQEASWRAPIVGVGKLLGQFALVWGGFVLLAPWSVFGLTPVLYRAFAHIFPEKVWGSMIFLAGLAQWYCLARRHPVLGWAFSLALLMVFTFAGICFWFSEYRAPGWTIYALFVLQQVRVIGFLGSQTPNFFLLYKNRPRPRK